MPKPPKPRKPLLERFPFTWFPFNLIRAGIYFLIDLVRMIRGHVEQSIRLQLMLTFGLCFGAALLFYGISSELFGQVNKGTVIDYSSGVRRIDSQARELVHLLEPPSEREPEAFDPRPEEGTVQAEPVPPGAATPETPIPAQPNNSSSLGQQPAYQNGSQPGSGSSGSAGTGQSSGNGNAPAASSEAAGPGKAGTSAEDLKKINESRLRMFTNTVKRLAANEKYKVVITNLEGKVVFRSDNAPETYVDVHSVIRNAMDTRSSYERYSRTEFSSFYPVTYNNQKSYLIVSAIPEPEISYEKGESPVSMLSALAVFIFLFYFFTQRKMRYVEELAGGLRIMATGNLEHRVMERSRDELGSLARDMNQMALDLRRKMEEERKAERLKNELVTNVSHDLRTPLTLIMGYLRLLHDKSYESKEQAASYVSIAYNKAEKLKGLIDDLFEYTKLSNQDVPLHKRGVAINDLLEQLLEEYVTISEEQDLKLVRSIPQERLTVQADVDKMIRVFDNLLGNAIKYSPKPGVISVGLAKDGQHAIIRISNKADALTREELEQLFDRFYRIDPARSSMTGGSGLGLAIARSIVDSHDGQIWAESADGDIHFYVKLRLAI
ncbi:HAMP domain-containing protein [Paenibacillus sp. UNCCL117]|nr:HAMP domain-containing protein [Paenibacillus sp. cl123]SFW45544.1 HAMP domain-containing protein [Paenibacillus sp. UNCCL117]